MKEGVELRYALSRNTEGQANLYFIDDQVREENRWAFFFRHDQKELPLGFYAKSSINLVITASVEACSREAPICIYKVVTATSRKPYPLIEMGSMLTKYVSTMIPITS